MCGFIYFGIGLNEMGLNWVMRKVGLKIIKSGWALTRFRNRVGFH